MTDMFEAAAAAGLTLSASLLAVPSGERLSAAEDVWTRGAWAHADVIRGRYGSRPSVSIDEITALSNASASAKESANGQPKRTDVHLMVDDPVDWCARLPPVDRITVQLHTGFDVTAVAEAVREQGAELWWAVDPAFATGEALRAFLAGGCGGTAPGGILVMLTPPGQAGYVLDLERLFDVEQAGRLIDSVGVDGGVGLSSLRAISVAGASYAVSGRALFS